MKSNMYIKKFKNFIKESLLLIITFILIFLSAFIYFDFIKNNNINNYLNELKTQFTIQHNITYENFYNLSQNSFYGIINKPEIYHLMKFAYKKDQKTQDTFRKALYEKLISDYKRLDNFKLKQIHFHFPDNSSFLRMHNPDKFGDSLADYRFSITQVNKNLRPLHGFEIGRMIDSFRFVYPLFDENLFHLGSVEVSVNSVYFDRTFEKTTT